MRFRTLSYILRAEDAVWPGNPPVVGVQPFGSIRKGGSSNTTILHLFSHSGSHLDAPKHYNDSGPCAYQLPIENYIFFKPLVLEVPKPDGGPILGEEVEAYADRLAHADVALLHTGWSNLRASEPRRYAAEGPFLHPDGARLLMEYPNLKAVGIDAVSIGSPGYRQEAVETHQILTGARRSDGRFLLILEDFLIESDLNDAARIYAWPLLIEGSDGSPCTMVAEFAD